MSSAEACTARVCHETVNIQRCLPGLPQFVDYRLMEKSLVVFQEHDLYFGVYPTEFKYHFSLNQVWISNSGDNSPIWRFRRKQEPNEGVFVHFGSLLELSQAHFDNGGYIFIKDMAGVSVDLGICISGLLMRIPLKKLSGRKSEVDTFSRFPTGIPRTIFKFVQQYRGKSIFVIDPVLLFRAFDIPGQLQPD